MMLFFPVSTTTNGTVVIVDCFCCLLLLILLHYDTFVICSLFYCHKFFIQDHNNVTDLVFTNPQTSTL